MKILVTGLNGQLVTCLVEAAKLVEAELIAVGRPELDLTAPETISSVIARHAPDIVINAAGYTAVDKAESDEDLAFVVNAVGPGLLADACAQHAIPLIHLSTDYVFDGECDRPYVESDQVRPICAYGRTKLEGERRIAAANPKHIILRTAWVHSPFGNNFVKSMLRLAGRRHEISVVSDQCGTPTYGPHLADTILDVARELGGSNWGVDEGLRGLYHAVGQGETTWYGLAREIFAVSARLGGPRADVIPIPTSDFQAEARRPANSRLDAAKLEAIFGVRLPGWRVGVEACVTRLIQSRVA